MGFSMSTCCSDFASLWALPCNFPSLSALPCNFPSHWVLPCIFVEYDFFSLALFPPSQHAGFSFHTKLQFQYVRDDLASGSQPANIPHIPGCHDTAHGKQLVPRGTHPLGTPGKDCARFASGGFHAFRFPARMKANQCWTSQAIVALLGQATNIQLPEPMRKQLMETIQSLQCAIGSHMKLANAGQHVQALAPYLSQTDWTKLGELQTLEDWLQALAHRLSKMGMANLKEATIEPSF